MSDLIERLNKRIVWWESSSRNNRLYDVTDCDLDQEVVDALEAREKTIAELVEGIEPAIEHIETLSELLKIIKEDWIDYDHVFSIAVHEADEYLSRVRISQAQSKDKAE